MRDIIRLMIYFLVGLLPIACSKGGDGPSPSSGRFIDHPVAGLHYSTLTHSGETNRNGEFSYLPGEIVRFSVGDIIIGEATGSAILSPFDLAGIVPPQTSGDIRRAANLASRSKQATSLEIAANIAIFLQSLDEDGDPSNGITIPDAMHSLARGISLNFKQKSYTFSSSFALRSLMAKGRAANLWGGTRPIRKPGQALDTLYAGLGLTPAIASVSIIDEDNNADGAIDLRETYTYDADGNLILHEQDNKADGTIESRTTYTYDANGKLTLAESDNGDEIVYYRWGYDDNGNLILFERDFNGDGTVNSKDTNTYDINGSLTLWEHFSDGIDGSSSFRRSFSYDSNGNQTLIEEDSNASGTINWRTTNVYGPNSKLIRTDGDTNADGIIDFRATYTYDSQDHLILIEQDDQLDGTVNSRQRIIYDTNGNQMSIEYEFDANGTIDFRVLFAYDANGNQTLVEFDSNGDGTAESRETDTYDINSNLTLLERDDNGDGTLDLRDSLVYDADSNLILEERDVNADGTVNLRRTFTNSPINRWSVLF